MSAHILVQCEGCGSETSDTRRWTSELVKDEQAPEVLAWVVWYCRVCAEREFHRRLQAAHTSSFERPEAFKRRAARRRAPASDRLPHRPRETFRGRPFMPGASNPSHG